jgi:hypothetical protein
MDWKISKLLNYFIKYKYKYKLIMKKWKCKIGFHNYENIGSQSVNGVVGGFSMTTLMRDVKKCKICGKVHFDTYDISTNLHLDEKLNWKPKLNY